MADSLDAKPDRSYWVISIVALLWNLFGVMAYIMQVTMTPEAMAELPEEQRMLYADIPAWVTGAYAIAVFAGTLGAIGLLLRKVWAVAMFAVSLVAIFLQMGHTLFMSEALAVFGWTGAILPLLVIVIALILVAFARTSRRKGILS
ncbi:MAG: hypothetical protein U5K76_03545 [Woeseiaceae bacterium]|nr:hypothetical protein [Woeseiaceae bacterium]